MKKSPKDAMRPEWLDDSGGECWVQLNVGLVRRDGLALPSARALFDGITPLVDDWRTAGKLQWFFFMRKPPDVRLRFRILASHDVRPALDAALLKLQREDRIDTFFYSTYQPETERFGGLDSMHRVHRYFDADTRAWLRLDVLERQGRRRLGPDALLPALAQDLFLHAAGGQPDLVAASWQNLWRLIATPAVRPLPEIAREALDGLSGLVGYGAEQECLACCAQANEALARELTQLALQGRLVGPLADVLASVALFSFHRHGFAGERSSPLVAAVMDALTIERRDVP